MSRQDSRSNFIFFKIMSSPISFSNHESRIGIRKYKVEIRWLFVAEFLDWIFFLKHENWILYRLLLIITGARASNKCVLFDLVF